MNIADYSSYFHDGGVINIQHNNGDISISMESAEITDEVPLNKELLSTHNTIKGKLWLKQVKWITVDHVLHKNRLIMHYDSGDIHHLKLGSYQVELQISWDNYPPKPRVNDFSTIEIEAEEIYWENIPDLYDPFW